MRAPGMALSPVSSQRCQGKSNHIPTAIASRLAPTVLIFSDRQSHGRPQSLWERACSGRRSDDEALSSNISIDCHAAIASKLAPTGGSGEAGLCGQLDLIKHAVRGDFCEHHAVGNAQQGIAVTTLQMIHQLMHHRVALAKSVARAVPKTCGSELARDEATTVNIDVECKTAIVSKLTPTRFRNSVLTLVKTPIK